MPPKAPLTNSFSVSEQGQDVVCPLKNQDGSNCRKRCLGEKRFRSMQEHIRRAHPEHYIPKLPATEESFSLMINSPPSQRPQIPASGSSPPARAYHHGPDALRRDFSSPVPPPPPPPPPPRHVEDQYPAAATAAVALAQLHSQRANSPWGSEADHVDSKRPGTSASLELPPIQNHTQDFLHPHAFSSPRSRELLPSLLSGASPPGRSTTLPPIHRPRPRKSSITEHARRPRHEKARSKDFKRRLSMDGRKAMSAEPRGELDNFSRSKRWEDLIEAATSANEAESDRDLTPVPGSPSSFKRSSMPPFAGSGLIPSVQDSYKASPLQRALTPPRPDEGGPEPFPSIEASTSDPRPIQGPTPQYQPHHLPSSSLESNSSGRNFHMPRSGLSTADTSPTFRKPVEIYCGNCRRLSTLKESFACDSCISGFCADCVYAMSSEAYRGRPCPRCKEPNFKHKPFQLDIRP